MVKKRVIESVVSEDRATKRWKASFTTGRMAYDRGQLKDARRLFSRALEGAQELPEHSFAVPACEIALAAVMLAEGKAKEAESRLSKSVSALACAAGFENKELLAVAQRFHAEALINTGDEREAEKELLKSIAVLESLGSDGAVQLAYSLCDLCGLYLTQERLSLAEQHITKALKILGNTLGPEHPEYTRADMLYAAFTPMSDSSRLDTVSDGIQRLEYAYGSRHPNIARALHRYLKVLEVKGEYERMKDVQQRFARALK